MKSNKKIISFDSNNIKVSLKERFKKYKGKNPVKFTWDGPKGKEKW